MANTSRVDCHAHVIAPHAFAYTNGPGYKPRPDETGDCERFLRTLDAHAVSHALLVQPSCYGYDNACMLDAMARSGGRFKGIAVVASQAGDKEWARLKEQGVVGVRLNLKRRPREPGDRGQPAQDFDVRLGRLAQQIGQNAKRDAAPRVFHELVCLASRSGRLGEWQEIEASEGTTGTPQ